MPTLETIVTLAVLVLVDLATLQGRSADSDDEPTPTERYDRGGIDEHQLERELAFHVDDRSDTIRPVVEDINGVGPDTSKAIAREFDRPSFKPSEDLFFYYHITKQYIIRANGRGLL